MRKDRKYGAMLWVNALAILVFGAGLILLAFYMSFEAGVIVSILAGFVVVAIAVTVIAVKAARHRRAKERPQGAPAAEDLAKAEN